MDVIFGVLLALLLIMALSITTIVLVVRAVVKRLRRSRAVGGAVLRTRAKVATGPRGRVLRLRVRLREALESGRAAMDVAANGTTPRGDLKRLFTRIEHEGESLDLQLRLMESETDVTTLNAELPTADRRVDQVVDLVHRLRSAVAAGLGDVSDDALAELHADVDREVAALHAGVQELRLLNQRDALGARPRAIRRAA